ncbi:chemotaxis protein CheW [Polaromonas sp.]|uniref:chemotaxis protein CheW n=1 Tax=Polaromonas sp. TaxID=1869339 RepID=UPI002FC7A500
MSELVRLVVFFLDGQRYALPLSSVTRIVCAAEVTPIPNAPAIVFGALNLQGDVIPVLDVRQRFQLPQRQIGVTDQFLIAQTRQRSVALVVDEAQGLVERDASDVVSSHLITPGLEQFQGVVKLDDGLVLIHDLEKFLSLDEAHALDAAMEQAP